MAVAPGTENRRRGSVLIPKDHTGDIGRTIDAECQRMHRQDTIGGLAMSIDGVIAITWGLVASNHTKAQPTPKSRP